MYRIPSTSLSFLIQFPSLLRNLLLYLSHIPTSFPQPLHQAIRQSHQSQLAHYPISNLVPLITLFDNFARLAVDQYRSDNILGLSSPLRFGWVTLICDMTARNYS